MSSSFYPARKIIRNVWIGSQGDAQDEEFMHKNDIRLVVNCSKDIPFYFEHIPGIRVSLDDDPAQNDTMTKNLPFIVGVIDAFSKQRGVGVLVHCYAGMQRSATCVAALLIKVHGWDPDRTMSWIKTKKPETFHPVPTFKKAMWGFYANETPKKTLD
jgi:protein-tyrosine phosphatase